MTQIRKMSTIMSINNH